MNMNKREETDGNCSFENLSAKMFLKVRFC